MKNRGYAQGFSLLQVLIALGVAGILALGISRMSNNTLSLIKKASIDDERNGMFSLLRKSVSCEKTYEALGQGSGNCGIFKDKTIPVYRSDRILIHRDGSRMGNWDVKAYCRDGEGLDIRVAYVGKGEQAQVDPVTKMPLDFDFPKNLLKPSLCFGADASSGPDLECTTASRTLGNVVSSQANVVQAFNKGTVGTETWKWGLTCSERYNRVSCAMSTPTKVPADYDITMIDRGCASDNDEWDGAFTLQIVCCRLAKPT